ncbi:MAG: response regulator, partial [Gammaproteobacteria bacterium]|nr:response regulator [Gammaproteobacteria bacterium]
MNTILAPVTPVLMLVDDEEGERIAIGEFLTELGYRVLHVDHPLLAVEQARDSLPDMIIIKAAMAQIDGCCLCTELHSSLQTQNIPVLMYSKEYDEDLVKRSFEAGAADYLTGPTLYWSMLRNRIKQLLKLQRT